MEIFTYLWSRAAAPDLEAIWIDVLMKPKSSTAECVQVPAVGILAGSTVPAGARAVYDPEHYDPVKWPYTPPEESADPVTFTRSFAAMCRGRGLIPGVAPSPDLMRGKHKAEMLIETVIGAVAPAVDFVDLQIQTHAGDPHEYRHLAVLGTDAVRDANPRAKVYAQLSTNPKLGLTVDQLLTAARQVRHIVSGFWLVLDMKAGLAASTELARRITEI